MNKLTFEDLRDGDQLFQRNNFNFRDINTYLTPIVYFGINFWNWIKRKPVTPINHMGTVYIENGVYVVFEAKTRFKRTLLTSKLDNADITALYIKRYELTKQQQNLMYYHATTLVGIDYDYISIVKQFFRQLFNQKIDLETNPNKFRNLKVNCSEANAEQLEMAGIVFKNTKSTDPDDLWKDERSAFVGYLKLTA